MTITTTMRLMHKEREMVLRGNVPVCMIPAAQIGCGPMLMQRKPRGYGIK